MRRLYRLLNPGIMLRQGLDEYRHFAGVLDFSLPAIDRSTVSQYVNARGQPLIDQFLRKRQGARPVWKIGNDEYRFHLAAYRAVDRQARFYLLSGLVAALAAIPATTVA